MKRKHIISIIICLCMMMTITACTKTEQASEDETVNTYETESGSIPEETEIEAETESVIETELAESIEDTTETTDTETTEPTATAEAANAAGAADAASGYTYTEKSATMYAKSSVNVRDLPSTEGNRLGSLSTNQEVVVTGQCDETGWYRIQYDGGEGYVSNNYIVPEKITASLTENITTTQSSEEFSFNRTMAESVFAMVNEERKAAGIPELTWDESIYDIAVQRCYENDVHASMRRGTGENYATGYYGGDAALLHQAWKNSSGHYNNYMSTEYTKGAVAIYECNDYFLIAYEVFLTDRGLVPTANSSKQEYEDYYSQNEYITSVTINGEVVYEKDQSAAPAEPAQPPEIPADATVAPTVGPEPKTEEEAIQEWLEQNPGVTIESNGVTYGELD